MGKPGWFRVECWIFREPFTDAELGAEDLRQKLGKALGADFVDTVVMSGRRTAGNAVRPTKVVGPKTERVEIIRLCEETGERPGRETGCPTHGGWGCTVLYQNTGSGRQN